ncbi:alpha/beta fold hydrolase [Prosthecobacter sp.]|uniref:alpha/beta fold hydrolase n=1 Tax=Prosthecobacter sp. TaxID=1965333 RepID=UPI0037838E3C
MNAQLFTLSSGRKLAYAEFGDPAGVPMFYFHGWPGSRLQGEFLHEVGKKRGLRVVAPDRPGIGLSEFQPQRKLLDWPADMAELAAHLGWTKFHGLGVSGGGPYVLACAHAMPERLLSAGVICGAPPLREVGTQDLMWTYRLALWGQRHVPPLLGPGLAAAGQFMRLPVDAPLMAAFVGKMCERDQFALHQPELYRILMASGRVGVTSSVRSVSTDGNIYSSDWGIDFSKVLFPLRYWHGGRDKNIPVTMIERFVRKMPNAKLTVFEEDGHYSLPMLGAEKIVDVLLDEARGAAK